MTFTGGHCLGTPELSAAPLLQMGKLSLGRCLRATQLGRGPPQGGWWVCSPHSTALREAGCLPEAWAASALGV